MPMLAFALGGVLTSYALVTYVTFMLVKGHAVPAWYLLVPLGLFIVVCVFAAAVCWAPRRDPAAEEETGNQGEPPTPREDSDDRARACPWALAVCTLACPPFVVLLIALGSWIALPGPNAARHDARYGAIVDAGSTGSRLTVFGWQTAGHGPPRVWEVASVKDTKATDFNCPLTDLLEPGARTCDCLEKLAARARDVALRSIGQSDPGPIPLWVKATAGVRRKEAPEQARILAETDRCLAGSPGYAWKGAAVISGAWEGVYAWLAVNYVAKSLETERVDDSRGIVEIGGQSAQIAYRVSGPISSSRPLSEVVTVSIGSRELHVFAASDYLGREAALEQMARDDGVRIEKGQPLPLPAECKEDKEPETCIEKRINRFVCSKAMSGANCSSRVQILLPPAEARFVGLSNFEYAARAFQVESASHLGEVRARSEKNCGSDPAKTGPRDELLKKTVEAVHRESVCFNAFYVTQVARDGWGLALDKISPRDTRWKPEPSWPLGAMLLEASKSARRVSY